ncbi:MAG: membrane protein insertion efficiency factor YidD [Candidatus Doudnabacteria bacterium]|nr:membrane protein insertion efficiency factor YidD [Candidatus Doudnabacteria bacterium]
MTSVLVKLIEIYQAILSPDHSFWGKVRFPYGYCRYSPTCSEFVKEAMKKHGFFRGMARGFARILRCNPFAAPKYDPVN